VLRPETATARKLRRAMPLPEVLLWRRLKASRTGLKFRRQDPIGPGEAHGRGDRPMRDRERDAFLTLTGNGYNVVRIMAATVLRDADEAATSVAALAANPLHRPLDGPPPRVGEDREAL
jgi:very-short-patch-repair endonuclease